MSAVAFPLSPTKKNYNHDTWPLGHKLRACCCWEFWGRREKGSVKSKPFIWLELLKKKIVFLSQFSHLIFSINLIKNRSPIFYLYDNSSTIFLQIFTSTNKPPPISCFPYKSQTYKYESQPSYFLLSADQYFSNQTCPKLSSMGLFV